MKTTIAMLSLLVAALLTLNGAKLDRKLTYRVTGRVTVEGITLELPRDDPFLQYLVEHGGRDTESMLGVLIKKELREGDTFVDVGANVGWFTLIAAKAVGPTGKVIAFEPEPRNFAKLKRNIEVNGLKNVILEQKAVSDRPGKVLLRLGELGENHSLVRLGDQKGSIEVDAVRLDDYLGDREIGAVKVDVEGAEGLVLAGMSHTRPRTLFLEYDPFLLRAAGTDPGRFLADLREKGYEIDRIDESRKAISPLEGVPAAQGNLRAARVPR